MTQKNKIHSQKRISATRSYSKKPLTKKERKEKKKKRKEKQAKQSGVLLYLPTFASCFFFFCLFFFFNEGIIHPPT
jgi:hypothetical protein